MVPAMKKSDRIKGEVIRDLREQYSLSQAELGAMMNPEKEASVISTWELNKRSPGTDSLFQLCAIFKVDANFFVADKYKETINAQLPASIDEAMEVLEGFKNAPKEKREAVLTILGKKSDGSK